MKLHRQLQLMERRYLLLLWTFFLLMNGVYSQQQNVDDEYEIVDEPAVEDQNVTESTECPGSVHTYLANTTKELFLREIMPEIEEELDQKDQENVRMNDSINEMKDQLTQKDQVINGLTNTVNEIKAQLQTLNMPKVIFNAIKTDGEFASTRSTIKIVFNEVTLNVGNAMNSDGFVAPIAGHYRFSFSAIGTLAKFELNTWVHVYKNGILDMYIGDSNDGVRSDGNNISHNWIWQLNKGDKVSFQVDRESSLHAGPTTPVNFNGELVFVET